MNREEFLLNYWKYYLLLEGKFLNSLNVVMLATDNFGAYSFEFVNQLLTIGSELDVVMKMTSGFQATDRKTISDYAPVILQKLPNITSQEVKVQGLECPIKPFENLNTQTPSNLKGWQAYNDVKHGRVENIKEAKLEYVLNLLACLYILEILNLKEISDKTNDLDIPDVNSALFELKGWNYKFTSGNDLVLKLIGGEAIIGGGNA